MTKQAKEKPAKVSQTPDLTNIPPLSPDDLVMRSINLPRNQDNELRELAYKMRTSKSTLIRAAIVLKLEEWRSTNSADVMADLKAGEIGLND